MAPASAGRSAIAPQGHLVGMDGEQDPGAEAPERLVFRAEPQPVGHGVVAGAGLACRWPGLVELGIGVHEPVAPPHRPVEGEAVEEAVDPGCQLVAVRGHGVVQFADR